MSLNHGESSRIGYKAKIEWSKERIFMISDGKLSLEDYLAETKKDFEAERHTPEELIDILQDLSKKSSKLEGKIQYLSGALRIPVNKDTQSGLYNAVKAQDPDSQGEYISYDLYDSLLRQQEVAHNNVNLDFVINNTSGDPFSDSGAIRNQILQGYSDYAGNTAKDNSLERYANRWLNNLVSWNEHDYQVSQILNFADNYMSMFPDPAYIPWSMRREVGISRVDAKGLSDVWKYFSADYADKVEDMVTGIAGFKGITPNPAIEGVTARYINYVNKFLNQVNYTFDVDFAADLVCCFMQWGVQLDLKTLKGLRALLQLLQTGLTFDYSDVLNGIKDIVNNIFRGLLCHQLLSLVTYIIQALADPIKKWLNDPQDGMWEKLFACTPINELMSKYIVESIDYMQELLTSLIQNWYKKIEIENIKNTLKVEWKNNQKIMGELAKLLDWIIYATEAASKCGVNNSPNSETQAALIDDYKIDSPAQYEFPYEETPTVWNSFISQDSDVSPEPVIGVATPGGGSAKGEIPSTNSTIGASQGSTSKKNSFEECLKNIPKDKIVGVQEWINIINAKSQEKAK